jgi:hypothetical protein
MSRELIEDGVRVLDRIVADPRTSWLDRLRARKVRWSCRRYLRSLPAPRDELAARRADSRR